MKPTNNRAALAAVIAAAMIFPATAASGQDVVVQVDEGRSRRVVRAFAERATTAPAAPGGRGMYTPKPKTETLDEPPADANSPGQDTVVTAQGDKLNGTVIDIDPAGRLRLTGPQFDGEVRILAASLDRVSLTCRAKDAGPDEVLLTNGDRIVGQITAVSPQAVVIHTSATGALTISRTMVQAAAFSRGQTVMAESNFASGDMTPWKVSRGNWSIRDGHLISNSRGSHETVYAEIEQAEPVTFEAKVEALNGYGLNFDLVLFADDATNPYGRNSVYTMFQSNYYYVGYCRDGGQSNFHSRHIPSSFRSGVFRAAYDPATGKMTIWKDSELFGEHAMPNKPKSGRYVMFNSRYACRISSLRVMRGIVPPSGNGGSGGEAETDRERVEFAINDRVSATSLSVADGNFTADTPYGPMNCEIKNVARIVFRTKGQEQPRRRKGDVRVQTTTSRMTLELEQLNDEYLIGSSDCLGQVKVLRGAVKAIQFNLYKQ